MKKILFVCTGNTCRSPMAAAICNHISTEFSADSCGIAANVNDGAAQNAVKALQLLYGIDISSHRAKLLSRELIQNADIIFVMNRELAEFAEYLFPFCKDKLYIPKTSVPDPFGQDSEAYKACAKSLEEKIKILISECKE